MLLEWITRTVLSIAGTSEAIQMYFFGISSSAVIHGTNLGVLPHFFFPLLLVATRFPPAGLFSLAFLRSLASNVSKDWERLAVLVDPTTDKLLQLLIQYGRI